MALPDFPRRLRPFYGAPWCLTIRDIARRAEAKGWTIVHCFRIEGYARGMRVALEYAPAEGRTYLNIDSLIAGVDRARLPELAETVGAKIELVGSMLKFVLHGNIDDVQLDRVIDAADAVRATGRPYRH